ncbi:NADH dehydrogenase [ubiquinone] iron-sulfur protein 6, mitochondrial [Rhododendron vialii]|uniref:NADH dehydrogenase [ubiquinone] iron-sulfur protein 6, mitochondrial n=1 Tax=Rhododendron vialii TaxID=182163 RepID=UPI00265DCECD|nr:NADH dehydrogenase [ubiquinone] iron-sulfur protein 6, mitochondrial [Rhododendron vialii]
MAGCGRKVGFAMASNLMRTLTRTGSSSKFPSNSRSLSGGFASSEIITSHTDKWMQDTSKKSPMELINEVPPIKVEGRIVACEAGNPALGHPIEFICLDLDEPAICKYCGLRYVQDHGHHHH